jgi:hypothetical protein
MKFLASAVVVVSALGCAPPPVPPSVVWIRVLDEAKAPVRDAEISAGAEVIARTDGDGRAEVSVTGKEGSTFNLEVRCPTVYRSPSSPLAIRRLQTTAAPSPEYLAKCSRIRHTLVIAIRAEGGANLPVLHLGKEVARTDESGGAHVLIDGEVHERVELQISTADAKHAKVHPQNPVAAFELSDRDELKVFEVKFTRDPKPVARAVARSAPKAF